MPDIQVVGVAAIFLIVVLAMLLFNEVELGGWGFHLRGKKPRRK
jgi:hypothetical protein